MMTLLGRLMGKKIQECRGEVRCPCGEPAVRVPNDDQELYLCRKCNKLLYYVEPSPGRLKVKPLSLAWLKKKY